MIEFACPHCGRQMRANDESAGKNGKCKSCGKTVTVPQADPTEAPTVPTIDETVKSKETVVYKRIKSIPIAVVSALVAVLLIGFVSGYYMGRRSVFAEVRAAFEGVGQAMHEGLGGANNRGADKLAFRKDSAKEPDAEENWGNAGITAQQGDIRVKIDSAKVDFVKLRETLGNDGQSKDKLLQISLQIENTGVTKKIEYGGWGGSDFSSDGVAALRDDLDNSYKRVGFGFSAQPVGQVRSESIYPRKSISDLLVFEVPIEKASFLKLELPGEVFGGTGKLRIKVPMKMVERP
ncbi:MAG: hypothetical protein ACLQIB_46265 [Isosphaeraceae bacterium]